MATSSSIRRRGERDVRLLVVVGLLLLGAAGATWWTLRGRAPAPIVQPVGTIAVPVATRPLDKGLAMSGPGLIRPMFLAPEQVPPTAILSTSHIVGRVTRERLSAGEFFSDDKLAAAGAPSGFSGIVRPGARIVVIEVGKITGAVNYIREGDFVDVMALSNTGVPTRGRGPSGATVQGGGTQPGPDGRRVTGNAATGAAGAAIPGITATLIAQGARVVLVPGRGRNEQFAALEMAPEDAHLMTMVMSTNQVLHFVYRPFNDLSRTPEDDPSARIKRPPRDSRLVEMIDGVNRSVVSTTLD